VGRGKDRGLIWTGKWEKIPRGLKMSLQEIHNSSIIGTVNIVMRIFGEEKKLE
jgi:hypothetical protein